MHLMRTYLESFSLPSLLTEERKIIGSRIIENGGYIDNTYPCRIFSYKGLSEVFFRGITILYGGNGSGKSTLLNLIAGKLGLNRIAPFNSGELFNAFVEECDYTLGVDDDGFPLRIPNGSSIITSDDVFDYMLAVRVNNVEIGEAIEAGKEEYMRIKFGETIKLNSLQDYEDFRTQVQTRRKSLSRRKFLRQRLGQEIRLNSNGETALKYFNLKLEADTLYCLDEPENSMSPKMQLELTEMLEQMARYCGCQFIIATHSPFLLAMEGARIYNLDTDPVNTANWWELENVRIYYDFFQSHKQLFENRQGKVE